MTNSIQPIARKTVYRVKFTTPTIDGNVDYGTRWYDNITDIPSKHLLEDNAQLLERSFDIFKKPTLEELREAVRTGNKYWLNTNETIKVLN